MSDCNPYVTVQAGGPSGSGPSGVSYGAPVLDWNKFFQPFHANPPQQQQQQNPQQAQQPQQPGQPQPLIGRPGGFIDRLTQFLSGPHSPAPPAQTAGTTPGAQATYNPPQPVYANNAPSPLDNAQWPAGPIGAPTPTGGLY